LAPQISFTVQEWHGRRDAIVGDIQRQFAGQRLAVRSSSLAEDSFVCSHAGAFASRLDVPNQPRMLGEAIDATVASYSDGNSHNQVLVQPMVGNVCSSGVVFTRSPRGGGPYYVINYSESSRTDDITSGGSAEHQTYVVYRAPPPDVIAGLPRPLRRLLEAVRELEELVDHDAIDVEYAIDDEDEVHILQVRPLVIRRESFTELDTRIARTLATIHRATEAQLPPSAFVKGKRAIWGVMPDWNPAEMIGRRPLPLALSLYQYLITDETWATQRAEFGYHDVRPCPLLRVLAGQPFVDARASINSFLPAAVAESLRERLADFFLERLYQHPEYHDKVEFHVLPTCYDLDFARWRQRLSGAGFLAGEVEVLAASLQKITLHAFDRCEREWETVLRLDQRAAKWRNSDRLSPLQFALQLWDDCRRFGTLPFAHLARTAFVAVALLRSLQTRGVLEARRVEDFLHSIRTISHDLSADLYAVKIGQAAPELLVARYGHLRPGTYDITSAKYGDTPEKYLFPLVDRAEPPQEVPFSWTTHEKNALRRVLAEGNWNLSLEALERFCRRAIEGREFAKFQFTKYLSLGLDNLVVAGDEWGIPRSRMAYLTHDDLKAACAGSFCGEEIARFFDRQIAVREAFQPVVEAVQLPSLLLSVDELFAFRYPHTEPNFVSHRSLEADLIHLVEECPPSSLTGKIVLVEKADPGFDWIFGSGLGGLITAYGGANSHMAIRASEFGLPAAIGVGEGWYERLSRARRVRLACRNQQIQIIE
jgi:hypothetical protein